MGTFRSDESGQIIVIAALLIAVLFVGLALVLNSAIYAENMATRGDTSTAEAMSTEAVTEEWLQQTIHTANYHDDDASYSERRTLIRENLSEWDTDAGSREAVKGKMYTVEEIGMTNGTRVVQNDTDDFLPDDGNLVDDITGITVDPLGIQDRTTWVPAPNVTTREFEMQVQRDSLAETEQSLFDTLESLAGDILTGSSAFWIQTERVEGDEMWRVYLVNDTDNDSVAAVVTRIQNDNESIEGVCRAEGDRVTVNLTEGNLVGEDGTTDCPVLEDVFGTERNHIYFVGADEVAGSYQFMTDVEKSEFEERVNKAHSDDGLLGSLIDSISCVLGGCDYQVYQTSPSDTAPYTTTAIYDVRVESTYSDDRITYTRNVTFPAAAR